MSRHTLEMKINVLEPEGGKKKVRRAHNILKKNKDSRVN